MNRNLISVFDVTVSYVDAPGSASYEHVSQTRMLVIARDLAHATELIEQRKPHCAIDRFERARYGYIVGIEEELLRQARAATDDRRLRSSYCRSEDHERCYKKRAAGMIDGSGNWADCECECHEEVDE